MAEDHIELAGSERAAPKGAREVSAAPPDEKIDVSIYLRAPDQTDDLLDEEPSTDPAPVIAETGHRLVAGASGQSMADVTAYATRMGLAVIKQDPARRLVKVRGSIGQLETAFGTKLHNYSTSDGTFRARTGSLSLPGDIVDHVEAVLGLESRPIAQPRVAHASAQIFGGYPPNQLARLYDFPPGLTGKGQCIAIIELGGGFTVSDNVKAFADMGLAVPDITAISVSGGSNSPGTNANADGEVALDIQVAGACAPEARLAVYFAPNTTQGFVDAVSRAVHDAVNKPSVISISWGSPEENWSGQGLQALNSAFRDAAHAGVTVLAAAGDNLATDGVGDGLAHVDFPAASPYVIGCGGTRLEVAHDAIIDEKVWNTGNRGTGGGISARFPMPAYQAAAALPRSTSTGNPGRGVPDIAADADPASGYRVVVKGISGSIGGTSAVAPLVAGLIALVNQKAGGRVGFIHPVLYGHKAAFRDIVKGNNRDAGIGYDALPGWDACTGLGTPIGAKLLAALSP